MSAFPSLTAEHELGRRTVLVGYLDRSGLYGVLSQLEMLGLDLVEVRCTRCPPNDGPTVR